MRNNSRYITVLQNLFELYKIEKGKWEGPKDEFKDRFFADLKSCVASLEANDLSRRHSQSQQSSFRTGYFKELSLESHLHNRGVEGQEQSINSRANRIGHALRGASNNPLSRPKIRRDPFKHLNIVAAQQPASPRRYSNEDNGNLRRNVRLSTEKPDNPSSKPPLAQVGKATNQRNSMGLNREKPRQNVPKGGNFSFKLQQVRVEKPANAQSTKTLRQNQDKPKSIECQRPARNSTFKPQNVDNELINQNRRNTLRTEEVRVRNSTNVNQTQAKNKKQAALRDLMKEIISKR